MVLVLSTTVVLGRSEYFGEFVLFGFSLRYFVGEGTAHCYFEI